MKKKLIQKLNSLRDTFPFRKEIQTDCLELKLSKDDKLVLTLQKKYKDEI
jgi:hypothetical protein